MNILKFLKSKALVIISLLIITVIGLGIFNYIDKLTYNDLTEKFYSMSTLMISYITCAGIFVALLQLLEYQNDKRNQLTIIKQEKSIDMMKEFADMLVVASFVTEPLENGNSDYGKLINRFGHNDYRSFRMTDLESKYKSQEDRKKLTDFNYIISTSFNTIANTYSVYYSKSKSEKISIENFNKANWDEKKLEGIIKKSNNVKEQQIENLDEFIQNEKLAMRILKEQIINKYIDERNNLLNRFEWFATYFNVGLADEEIAYQSLHQVYITTIMLLYPYICEINSGAISDHYYTNVVNLYKRWSDKLKKVQDLHLKSEEKMTKTQKRI